MGWLPLLNRGGRLLRFPKSSSQWNFRQESQAESESGCGVSAGLLEQPVLLIHAGASGRRVILDMDKAEVGFAWWQRPHWWQSPILSVHERPDAPLVFTVQAGWWSLRHDVRDAEGEGVGFLGRGRIFDRWGEELIYPQRSGPSGRWVDRFGTLTGVWLKRSGEVRLEFGSTALHDPFTCMLLLAFALEMS